MSLPREQLAAVCTFAIVLAVQGGINREKLQNDFLPEPARVTQFKIAPLPVKAHEPAAPELTAQTAVAIDFNSAGILFEKDADKKVSPASTTKLMTAVVARQVYEPNSVLTVPALASITGNRAGLSAGEQFSLESLLEAALIPSGNDAAYTLSSNYPQGEQGFITAMNAQTVQLHMTNTQYQNSVGYDHELQFTTAFDLALLGREVLKDPLLAKIVAMPRATVLDLSGKRTHTVTTSNQLLLADPRVVGIKTGTTGEAGEVLISQYILNEHPVTIVVMGSLDRYEDTRRIVEWVLASYDWQDIEEE